MLHLVICEMYIYNQIVVFLLDVFFCVWQTAMFVNKRPVFFNIVFESLHTFDIIRIQYNDSVSYSDI